MRNPLRPRQHVMKRSQTLINVPNMREALRNMFTHTNIELLEFPNSRFISFDLRIIDLQLMLQSLNLVDAADAAVGGTVTAFG